MKKTMWIASLLLSIIMAGCSNGGESAVEETESTEAAVTEEASAEETKSSEASEEKGEPACGNELLDRLPSLLPFPEGADIYSVCEEANDYGSGIAVSYQWTGKAEELAQLYRDALQGEYEHGEMNVLDITSMQFTKDEEAIVIEIDASSGDSKLSVHLSHGIYPGGYDNAVGGVLNEIVGEGDSDAAK